MGKTMTFKEGSRALTMVGSEDRAAKFVEIAPRLDDPTLKRLLIEFWTVTEAWSGSGVRKGMFDLMNRVGYISDTDERPAEDEDGLITIYRGNLGEIPFDGHAWTTSVDTAEMFAKFPFSMRGMFLGLGRTGSFGEMREDAVATVWAAQIEPEDILGYFTGRNEFEVVVDPYTLIGVVRYRGGETGMTDENLKRLLGLLRVHVPPAVEEFMPQALTPKAGRCLPSTRIGLETLRYFGVKAEPLPTRVMVVNAAWQEWMHGDAKGAPPMPDEAWSVAVGWPSPGRGIDVHLVIAVEGAILLDLNSKPLSRPGRAMGLDDTTLLPLRQMAHPVTGEMLLATGMDLDGGGRIDYVEHPNPPAWKQGKDYRMAGKPAGKVIRLIREEMQR